MSISATVKSLPLKDVIIGLAETFKVNYKQICNEYYLELPEHIGVGEIRGVNFDNGLGIIVYDFCLNVDLEIKFVVKEVHPVKYIYAADGNLTHSFANEKDTHILQQYQCAIVASQDTSGHILSFNKNNIIKIVSLEIDREKFISGLDCEIENLVPELKSLFSDIKAKRSFYHEGFFSLDFKDIFNETSKYGNSALIRKFHLESVSLSIFVKQIELFEDDILGEGESTILRSNEIKNVEMIGKFITDNIAEKFSVQMLSSKSGINQNKLQAGFKHLFSMTVTEFIIEKRLTLAARLLEKTNDNIIEIGLDVGIENASYFTKLFKNKYGVTPKEYRKLNKNLRA